MAIGDSISAAALAKGQQKDSSNNLHEWRGVSYALGGDPGALTIPNVSAQEFVRGEGPRPHGPQF